MTQAETIEAWKRHGVSIEPDTAGYWHWYETNDGARLARYDKCAERARMPDGSISASRYITECNYADSVYSPFFPTFEACVADLVQSFGPLNAQCP